jgi:hypothetical protein
LAGYDDLERRPPRRLTGLDGMFANTHIIVLVIFAFCCNPISLILGVVGLLVCKDPGAKQNAMIVTIISGILLVIGILGQIARFAIK